MNRTAWSITDDIWNTIVPHLRGKIETLELGSGYSTILFSQQSVIHTAVEDDEKYYLETKKALVGSNVELIHAPFKNGWYDWVPKHSYDLIFIDGPSGKLGREGILKYLHILIHKQTTIIADDVHRHNEMQLAKTIGKLLNKPLEIHGRVGIIHG